MDQVASLGKPEFWDKRHGMSRLGEVDGDENYAASETTSVELCNTGPRVVTKLPLRAA